MTSRWSGALLALALAGCGGGASTVVDAGATVPGSDAGPPAVDAGGDRFAAVRAELDRALTSGEVPGFSFVLRDASETPLFEHAGGAYTRDQLIPLDSSIKPVTSLVILSLVDDGMLALDDTLAEHLGWSGPEGTVTVEQLLAFSSGYSGAIDCLSPVATLDASGTLRVPRTSTPLAQCADELRAAGLIATPGAEFHYGGTHQMLLALIAERVTGQTWDALFDARVRAPLGLGDEDIRYVSNRVAGSAVGTAPAHARIYRQIALEAGLLGETPSEPIFFGPELAARFLDDYIAAHGVTIVQTPWDRLDREAHFGLGIWIDCRDFADPATCVYVGAGANGTTVWIDPRTRHVAALVLYQRSLTGYVRGVALMDRLLPLVRDALR